MTSHTIILPIMTKPPLVLCLAHAARRLFGDLIVPYFAVAGLVAQSREAGTLRPACGRR